MKKIYSLFIMLALFCLSWTAKAQETLTVYEGTETSNYVPAYVFYFDDFTRSQVVFPATDLAEMNGGTINSVTFYTTSYNIPYTTVSTVDVYLMEVGYTTIEAYEPKESATIVYQGTLSFESADDGSGVLTIEFSSPYTYNGGNLLIGIDNTTDAGWKNMNFYGQTITGASIAGSNGSDASAAPATQRNFIPMTTFEYTPAGGVTCAKPTGFNVSDVQAHGATLTWNPGDDASSWIISCIHGDEEDLIETGENSYTFTDLIPETSYTVKVSAYCGGGNYSSWTSNKSFTTLIACPAPTGLTASLTPGDGSVADLSWTPFGGTTSWILQYGTDNSFETFDDEVYVDGTPATTLYGLTAETTYYARVKADCGSEDGESVWSTAISFTPTDAYSLTLNEGTSTNGIIPVYGWWADNITFSQFIIPASELTYLQGGEINSLTFYSNEASVSWGAAEFDVLLKEVDFTDFSENGLEDWDDMFLTYSGSLSVSGNKMVVQFTSPYTYEEGNLLFGFHQTVSGSYVTVNWQGTSQETSTAAGGYGTTGYAYQFLPKVTINYTPGTPTSCPKPAELSVSEIGPHSAVLSWTEKGEATAWQICLDGDETNPIDVTENPYTLTGLDAVTSYTVKVRAMCDGDDPVSAWTGNVGFTTNVACPAPTALSTSDVTGHTANLSWEGFGDSYNVRYRIGSDFLSSFEQVGTDQIATEDYVAYTFDLSAYEGQQGRIALRHYNISDMYRLLVDDITLNDGIGDVFTVDFESGSLEGWTLVDNDGDGNNWQVESSTSVDANENYFYHSATHYLSSESYINDYGPLYPDNWLISPMMNLGGTLTIYARGMDPAYADEVFGVFVSTQVEEPWSLAENISGNSYTLPYLSPETTYEVQVQSECGEDGQSQWSNSYYFTTPEVSCEAPTDLTYYALSYNSVVLDWSELNADGNAWEICINGDEENLIPASSNHDFLLSGLTPNTEYTVKVRTICGTDTYSEWGPETIFITEACPVPANLTVSDITKYTALLMWDGNTDIMGWQICLNGDEDHLMETGTTSYNLTELLPGTDYTVKVRSICGEDLYSDWSVEVPFVTEPCTDPTSLSATGITKNTAILDWAENGDATAWQIMVNNDEENLINVTEHPYTLTGLNPETEYTVSVRAICIEGIYSEWSEPVLILTDLACHAPTELTVNDITSGDAILNWQGEGLTYNIRYRTTDDEWMEINEAIAPYTLTGLQPGTNYDVQVQAICGEDVMSFWSDMVSFSTLECPAPTVLIVSDITKNSVVLSWTENGDATAWQLSLNEEEENLYNVTENPFTITGLAPEMEYTVKVRAVCGGGAVSEWSETVNFVTDLACHAPTDLAVSDITSGDAVLTWLGEGINYILQYKMASEEDWYQVDGINSPYTLGGLQPDVAYEIKLKANCDSYGTSLWTEIVNFTTLPCPAPTTVTVSNITQNNATVSWTESGDASAWQICFNGDEENLINVTTIPYTLTGMNPETEYTVKVRANCGGGASSEWSELVTFTTQMASVVPTILTVTGELSFCPGGSTVLSATSDVIGTYTWSTTEVGQQITATNAGSYSVTVTTATGDWLADTVYVVEKESYEINVERAICYNELPYTWNNVVFTAGGGETVTLEAQNGCDSVVHMNLIVNPIYTTPLNESICEGQSYDFFGTMLTEAGIYTDTLPTANGCNCDSIFVLNLTVNPLPIVTISGEPSFCQDGSTTLTADGAVTYEWSNEDNTATTIITAADTYTVTGTDANNCSNTAEVAVTMKLPVNTPIAAAICEGQSYPFFDEQLTVADVYTHTLTAANGCDSVITLTLTVNPLPTITINGENEFCQGESTTLTADGAVSYIWSTEAETAAINVNEADTYTVTGTDANNCVNTAEVTVTMNMPANTPLTVAICEGQSYTFFEEELTEADVYTHVLETVKGCDSVITLTLTVNPLPNVTIIGNNSFCQDGSTTLTADGAVTYEWSNEDNTASTIITAADTYTVTGTDANNCSNTAEVTVTMNLPTTGIFEHTACDSYTWIDGQTYTASTNTPTFTLENAAGCDSVVTLNLTIINSTTGVFEHTACDSYTWIDGQTYTASTNTPTYTLENAAGCDSVVTLNLTIIHSTSSVDVQTACGSYTWIDGQTYTASTNTPFITLENAAGCDSVVTLHLTINNPTTGVDVQTACDSYTWIDGQTYTESTNEPTYTLTNAAGCDSVVTLNLTINHSNTGVDVQTACDSYTWIDGQTYTASTNTPTYTLQNAAGCDSVVTLNLTVNHSVTSEFTIETAESCYEWNGTEYCQSGDYTQNLSTAAGCDSVVTLHLTVGVGIEEHNVTLAYLAPNPATNTCRIMGLDTDPVSVDIYDMNGKLVRRDYTTELDVTLLPTGIYMVRVLTSNRIIDLKLVKQ